MRLDEKMKVMTYHSKKQNALKEKHVKDDVERGCRIDGHGKIENGSGHKAGNNNKGDRTREYWQREGCTRWDNE